MKNLARLTNLCKKTFQLEIATNQNTLLLYFQSNKKSEDLALRKQKLKKVYNNNKPFFSISLLERPQIITFELNRG